MNVGDEKAVGSGTRERIGADAEPADVLVAVLRPQLLGLFRNGLLGQPPDAGVDLPALHRAKVAPASRSSLPTVVEDACRDLS